MTDLSDEFGVFTYLKTHKNQPSKDIGKYTSPMDPMGLVDMFFGL